MQKERSKGKAKFVASPAHVLPPDLGTKRAPQILPPNALVLPQGEKSGPKAMPRIATRKWCAPARQGR